MAKIKVAVAGVGNCASALVQGLRYYSKNGPDEGLTYWNVGGYTPKDLEFVAAFDVNAKKVGKDLSQAIFQPPNNTVKVADVPSMGVKVMKGPVLDGIGKYLKDVVPLSPQPAKDIVQELKDSGTDVLVNYLPVGSTAATQAYAEAALKAKVAFVNAIPVFIASDERWSGRFAAAGLPVAGDDVMSQVGATVLHKTLVKMAIDRGVKVDETYQLNIGGDTDFLNMLEESRLKDKRESKTSAVRAMSPYEVPTRIGPSDYVPFLDNDKVCYIWLKGRYFGGSVVKVDVKLHVVDAYDSGGVMVDAIRGTKVALDRGVSGQLESLSAYCFKHPPTQMPYPAAKAAFEEFTSGKRER
ncbi:MAG: inositol-3-phosphate synthase [Nitrososphaerota archaeon]|jgi:myo-inositol-1-phosphate synthase|nr:inositol-3-phosphate synthase [Nitrososphaerota archaeon]MCL5672727.1 inositol-3-phosphate synthase [Nitrososphaerota archaeon]MDG6912908.1 inositol-3-phosphate synthase [Nitrososphaerota archaeon]MDG6945479.1 inositol-3-phosphate synthase [Nitrososphaerota archaeon]MDG6952053.1 inositol-3-phosphate synthase [Nitrososphaerota archaeon]